jgi:hypothetical protein
MPPRHRIFIGRDEVARFMAGVWSAAFGTAY